MANIVMLGLLFLGKSVGLCVKCGGRGGKKVERLAGGGFPLNFNDLNTSQIRFDSRKNQY